MTEWRTGQSSISTCLTVFVPSLKITFTSVPGTDPAGPVVAGVTVLKKTVRVIGWSLTSWY
jgi:hypothetical protein